MKYVITIILAALIIFTIQDVNAQWVQVNAPTGGMINHLASNGSDLFGSTDNGGVFFRKGDSHSWIPVNKGLSDIHVHTILASGDMVFVGNDSGICISADNG